jgi:hypothetical protein
MAPKHFASQSPVGNIQVTSAPYEDPIQGWQMLHFAVSFQMEMERLYRDMQIVKYHSLQEKAPHLFSGNTILGSPVSLE